MTLVLEVEYLLGVSFAAIGPDSEAPDWPPQPDRVFSALVAAWAARGEDEQEAEALEWLESLPPPRILASDADARSSATVFVPPNDPRSDRQKNAKGVLPALRSRQGRRFPATRPHDPVVRLFWVDALPAEQSLSALQLLARDTTYIGHSASLTRCRFLLEHDESCLREARPPERRVYAGRFAELRRNFDAGRRPDAGAPVKPVEAPPPDRANPFGERWLLFEHVRGDIPDIRACALVAKTLRDTLLSGYQSIGLGDDIPEVVSGHAADGGPTCLPHLAVVPLSYVGFPHSDGHVMGFGLIPPHGSRILEDGNFLKVMRRLAPIDESYGRRVLTLTSKKGASSDAAFSFGMSPSFELPANKRSLDPLLYTRQARAFATVTPIVLDRHLRAKGSARQEEISTQIIAACRNIGLPEPDVVVGDKHSAIEGAPSAYPSGKSPAWLRWRLTPALASRQLTHAVIRFAQPVEGPVLLGAGRFQGLGLCRPLDPEKR